MWPINTQQHGTLQNKKVHIRSSAQKIQDTVTHTVTHTHYVSRAWLDWGCFVHPYGPSACKSNPINMRTHTESDAPKVWLCNHKTLSIKNDRRRWWRREIWGEDVIYRVSNKSGEGRVGMLVWVRAVTTSCWFPSHGCCTGKKKKSLSLKCCCSGGRRSGCSYTARPAGEITTVCDICFDIQMPSYKGKDEHIQEGGKRRTNTNSYKYHVKSRIISHC